MPSAFVGLGLLICIVSVSYAGMVGGLTPQDPNDPEYMERAWKAAKGINDDGSNAGPYHMMPIKVLSAKTQVVAGIKHIFEVLFAESSCKKGDTSAADLSAANCQPKEDGKRAIYEIELWEKPWENFEQFNVKKVKTLAAGEQV
ncbi:cystatin domain protein [Teladorsagia circumcincta]|uniref:Cystatin domain protein n=1 Tax=Teladorsagia circumcincta TaxID=45464 RepID=A0A2G9UKM7_TELCI|nr:cystatin domain protein [Teladorsagia circumcincta]